MLFSYFKSFKPVFVKRKIHKKFLSYACFTNFVKKTPVSKVISLTDVRIYQQETLILSNVSLELQETEFAFLIGKTGI